MFSPHKSDHGAVLPWEYMPAKEGVYQAGQLLNADGGSLAAVSSACSTTPGYLCMGNVDAEEGTLVPVTRVQKEHIYETTLSQEAADAAIGSRLQVSYGGLQVDAAAEGSFEVTYIEGTAAGSTVYGRFV